MAKWIIGGMAFAIAIMAGYIVKLWKDRDEERKRRIQYLEDINRMTQPPGNQSAPPPPTS